MIILILNYINVRPVYSINNKKFMRTYFVIIASTLLIAGCSKMEEKSPDSNKPQTQQTPNTNPPNTSGEHGSTDSKSSGTTDEKANELVTIANESLGKYAKDPSDDVKKETIANCMAAANYLMFEAGLPAKEKYRPALRYYRQILAIDPSNDEAAKNKKQIEDIYVQMGMPIPQ